MAQQHAKGQKRPSKKSSSAGTAPQQQKGKKSKSSSSSIGLDTKTKIGARSKGGRYVRNGKSNPTKVRPNGSVPPPSSTKGRGSTKDTVRKAIAAAKLVKGLAGLIHGIKPNSTATSLGGTGKPVSDAKQG